MPRADPYDYDETKVEYWLAQMTNADLYVVLAVVAHERFRRQTRDQLSDAVKHLCHVRLFNSSTGKVRNQVLKCAGKQGLIVQVRHSENDWTRGIPEFVRPGADPLGFVNIAAYLVFLPQLAC
jgi:hypothetical protein